MAKYYALIILGMVSFIVGAVFSLLLVKYGRFTAFRDSTNQGPMIDELTDLFNRRYFEYKLANEFRRVLRYRRPLSIILLDIDSFKKVNDQLGHKIGNIVLEKTASLIKANLRNVDIASHHNANEFALIMPETEGKSAMIVAERLRKAYKEILKEYRCEEVPLTISIGVAEYPQSAQTSDDLAAAADIALHYSKNNGRDQSNYYNDLPKQDKDKRLKSIS